MIVSSLAEEGAEETVAALALGAADTIPKPGTGRFNGRFSEVLMAKLRALDLVDTRRDRQMIYYSCKSDAVRELLDRLHAAGCRLSGLGPRGEPFGMTEAGPVTHVNLPGKPPGKMLSMTLKIGFRIVCGTRSNPLANFIARCRG